MHVRRLFSLTWVIALALVALAATSMALARNSRPRSGNGAAEILGSAFTFQGRLHSNGSPVEGSCDMALRLYDQAIGGDQVGSAVTHTVVITDGLFTRRLDFGSSAFRGERRWLGIKVKCTDDATYADLGRQELTAAPYALFAKGAPWSGLSGVPAGFADGVDDVAAVVSGTNIYAGPGLTQLSSGQRMTLSVRFAGSEGGYGIATAVARSDHHHDAAYVNDDAGQVGDADVSVGVLSPDRISGTAWTGANDGESSGLDADLLDGQQASAFATNSHAHDGVYINDDAGEVGDADVPVGGLSPERISGTAWTGGNDGTGSGLDADTLDGQHAGAFATNSHGHDERYYTEAELQTSGSANIHWDNLASVPAGLSDGDDDTTYSAGTGVMLNITEFSVATAYRLPQTCSDGQVAEWNDTSSQWACGEDDTGAVDAFWVLTGNAGTTPGTNFVGTTDNVALELRVNGTRAQRLEPDITSPNLIGGYSGNSVSAGVAGATVGGGGYGIVPNRVTDNFGSVGGGANNRAGDGAGSTDDAEYATVGGGFGNVVSGTAATVGGGVSNRAGGDYATVPGGSSSRAQGSYSFAAGRSAWANNSGCFVWGDSSATRAIECNIDDRWMARASGGVYFYTNSGLTSGAYLAAGSSAWSTVSDRDRKENLIAVDGQRVLDRLAEIPISTWNYKSQAPSVRHMGPMAQDFYAAFGLGEEALHISTVDVDGVALAGLQRVYQLSQAQAARIKRLEAENAAQQRQIDDLTIRLETLERVQSRPVQGGILPSAGLVLVGLSLVWLARRGGAPYIRNGWDAAQRGTKGCGR